VVGIEHGLQRRTRPVMLLMVSRDTSALCTSAKVGLQLAGG